MPATFRNSGGRQPSAKCVRAFLVIMMASTTVHDRHRDESDVFIMFVAAGSRTLTERLHSDFGMVKRSFPDSFFFLSKGSARIPFVVMIEEFYNEEDPKDNSIQAKRSCSGYLFFFFSEVRANAQTMTVSGEWMVPASVCVESRIVLKGYRRSPDNLQWNRLFFASMCEAKLDTTQGLVSCITGRAVARVGRRQRNRALSRYLLRRVRFVEVVSALLMVSSSLSGRGRTCSRCSLCLLFSKSRWIVIVSFSCLRAVATAL